MSTLWTPGGEVPVGDRPSDAGPANPAGASDPSAADAAAPEGFDLDSLSPEEREQAEQYIRELAESRERLRSVPASVVVANHAMGLYELAALHLANQPPNFTEATVAIDALSALLNGMKSRLGEPEATLREGLSQLQMAFAQLKTRPEDPAGKEAGDRAGSNDEEGPDSPAADTDANDSATD